MGGWLNDDFSVDEKAERLMVHRITARASRRRALQRAVASSSVLAVAVCAVVGASILRGTVGEGVSALPQQAGRTQGSAPTQPSPASSVVGRPWSSPLPVTLAKVDHSVAVAWEGESSAEYVVYRCNSPKFDTCSLADRVTGTQWVDSGAETGTITFYRVEKKA